MYKKTFFLVLVLILISSNLMFANQPSIAERIKATWADRLPNAVVFSEGLASVKVNNKFGFMDGNGKMVIQPKYDLALNFSEGFAAVSTGNKAHYIDKAGKEYFKDKFNLTASFYKGYGVAYKNNKAGLIDKSGKLVLNHEFDYIAPSDAFVKGMAVVMKNGKYGLIDLKTKKYVLELKHDSIWQMPLEKGEGVLIAAANNKTGVYDLAGKAIVPMQYENAAVFGSFLGGMVNGKATVYNAALRKKIFEQPAKTFEMSFETRNVVKLILDSKSGILSSTGKVLVPIKFSDITILNLEQNLYGALDDGKLSVYNDKGSLIVPPTSNSSAVHVKKDEFFFLPLGITIFDRDLVMVTHQGELSDAELQEKSNELMRWPVTFYDMQGKVYMRNVLTKAGISYGDYEYTMNDGKIGLSKKGGAELLSAKYEDVVYNGQLLIVKENGYYTILDRKTLAPVSKPFTYLYAANGAMTAGTLNQKTNKEQYNIILSNGKLLLDKNYADIYVKKLPSGYKWVEVDSTDNDSYKIDKVCILDAHNKLIVALTDGEEVYETYGANKEVYFVVVKDKNLKTSPLSVYNSKGKLIFKR